MNTHGRARAHTNARTSCAVAAVWILFEIKFAFFGGFFFWCAAVLTKAAD